MLKISIDKDRCKGCGLCINFCPQKILEFSSILNASGYQYARCISEDSCISCASCALMCPDCCIKIEKADIPN